ncbi:hypothetical protein Tco_1147719 [Tanacetum coccineum]
MQDKSMTFLPYSSGATVKATYSFSKFKDKSSDIKQNLKTVLNFKDTLPQALINKNFLNELFQSRKIQDYLNAKDQDIKLKDKDIKSKIKIQDHKHAKGTSKEFLRTQDSKIQDVTRSEAISKTSFEVESDTEPLILTTFGDIQALLDSEDELKDESNEEMYEAKKEMDYEIQQPVDEETHPPHSTNPKPTEDEYSTE